MIRLLLTLSLAVVSPLPAETLSNPTAANLNPAELAKVSSTIGQLITEGKLVGAVTLIARDGKLGHLAAQGFADKRSQTPMSPDTIFRIHSMTKALTSTLALMCYEEGKFEPTDPVSNWIPAYADLTVLTDEGETRPASTELTVADLMRHSAGMTYAFFGNGIAEKQHREKGVLSPTKPLTHTAETLATIPLLYDPGTGWSYGTSVDVLGRLVEIWTGHDLATVFHERLTEPLGMVDTAFHVPTDKRHRLASLYTQIGNQLIATPGSGLGNPKVPSSPPTFAMPGGGLYSTATDYWKFLQMIADKGSANGHQFLKPETVALMTHNQLPDGVGWINIGEPREGVGYGFGFSTREKMSDWDPDGALREFGWGGAASCHYWVRPSDKLIVITLEQTMPYNWNLELALKGLIYKAAK